MVTMARNINILIILSTYLPGYKAGGPIKTILNLVDQLGHELKFYIVTSDRDLGDQYPYPGIKLNEWCSIGNAEVFYLSREYLSTKFMVSLINNTDFDILYLNSFFDFNFTIRPLLARRLGLIKRCPVVLAPRGEFSAGALALKSTRKQLFILFVRWFGLYRGLVWQASSEFEKRDIIAALDVCPESVCIAKDLPVKTMAIVGNANNHLDSGPKLVFLSRISPMKNLDFALKVLSSIKCMVTFDIYGPIEDQAYWNICQEKISRLPTNIQVKYFGAVSPVQVSKIFGSYDLFFFPTRGENYGHVIAESLAVGTPVLISDQTPWRKLEENKLGWDLPLDNEVLFVHKIESLSKMTQVERYSWRRQVAEIAASRIHSQDDVKANKALFQYAVTRQSN